MTRSAILVAALSLVTSAALAQQPSLGDVARANREARAKSASRARTLLAEDADVAAVCSAPSPTVLATAMDRAAGKSSAAAEQQAQVELLRWYRENTVLERTDPSAIKPSAAARDPERFERQAQFTAQAAIEALESYKAKHTKAELRTWIMAQLDRLPQSTLVESSLGNAIQVERERRRRVVVARSEAEELEAAVDLLAICVLLQTREWDTRVMARTSEIVRQRFNEELRATE